MNTDSAPTARRIFYAIEYRPEGVCAPWRLGARRTVRLDVAMAGLREFADERPHLNWRVTSGWSGSLTIHAVRGAVTT